MSDENETNNKTSGGKGGTASAFWWNPTTINVAFCPLCRSLPTTTNKIICKVKNAAGELLAVMNSFIFALFALLFLNGRFEDED